MSTAAPGLSARAKRTVRIENISKGAVLANHAQLADMPWSRMKGLLGRAMLETGEGLVIRPCQGVHSFFMRFPIDVLHVDAHGTVRKIVAAMPPNRFGPTVWRASFVVELPAGSLLASGTEEGDHIEISDAR